MTYMSRIRNPLHFEIIPSPGTQIQDWAAMKEKLDLLFPFVESIHLDFVDGIFVNNKNFMNPLPFLAYAKGVNLEAHFVTDNPIQYIKPFADAGFTRFIGQVEKMPDIAAFIAEGQLYGEVGLAIDGPTTLESLQLPLGDLDMILFYTGDKVGFSGGTLLPERLEKVRQVRALDQFIPIEIDGGVNDKNIQMAKEAGVTRFVSTGYIFSGNPEEQYNKLKSLIGEQ